MVHNNFDMKIYLLRETDTLLLNALDVETEYKDLSPHAE